MDTVKVRCPFHGRECIEHSCAFCRNRFSSELTERCSLADFIDRVDGGKEAFDARINEAWADAGGYE